MINMYIVTIMYIIYLFGLLFYHIIYDHTFVDECTIQYVHVGIQSTENNPIAADVAPFNNFLSMIMS
jgi:hypothetical protein